MTKIKIRIQNLYKVFGKNAKSCIPLIEGGMRKDEY